MGVYINLSNEQGDEIERLYRCNISARKVSQLTGVSNHVVFRHLHDRKLVRKAHLKENSSIVNHQYFDIIDSEQKAYWLGFFAADGCVNGNRVSLVLNKIDSEQIIKFKESLEIGNRIYYYKDSCCIRFSSSHMLNKLQLYGIIPRKSLILQPPKNIPQELMIHFWRGAIDGDGTICWGRRNVFYPFYHPCLHFCSGSKDFVIAFRDFCVDILGKNNPSIYNTPNTNVHYIRFSHKSAEVLITYFYKTAQISLERKQNKANEIIERYNEKINTRRSYIFELQTSTI